MKVKKEKDLTQKDCKMHTTLSKGESWVSYQHDAFIKNPPL